MHCSYPGPSSMVLYVWKNFAVLKNKWKRRECGRMTRATCWLAVQHVAYWCHSVFLQQLLRVRSSSHPFKQVQIAVLWRTDQPFPSLAASQCNCAYKHRTSCMMFAARAINRDPISLQLTANFSDGRQWDICMLLAPRRYATRFILWLSCRRHVIPYSGINRIMLQLRPCTVTHCLVGNMSGFYSNH